MSLSLTQRKPNRSKAVIEAEKAEKARKKAEKERQKAEAERKKVEKLENARKKRDEKIREKSRKALKRKADIEETRAFNNANYAKKMRIIRADKEQAAIQGISYHDAIIQRLQKEEKAKKEIFTFEDYKYVPNSYHNIRFGDVVLSFIVLEKPFLKGGRFFMIEFVRPKNVKKIANTLKEHNESSEVVVSTFKFANFNVWPEQFKSFVVNILRRFMISNNATGCKVNIGYGVIWKTGENSPEYLHWESKHPQGFNVENDMMIPLDLLLGESTDLNEKYGKYEGLVRIFFNCNIVTPVRCRRYFPVDESFVGRCVLNPRNSDLYCILYCIRMVLFNRNQQGKQYGDIRDLNIDINTFEKYFTLDRISDKTINPDYMSTLGSPYADYGFLDKFKKWKDVIDSEGFFDTRHLSELEDDFNVRLVVFYRQLHLKDFTSTNPLERYQVRSTSKTTMIHPKKYKDTTRFMVPLWLISTDDEDVAATINLEDNRFKESKLAKSDIKFKKCEKLDVDLHHFLLIRDLDACAKYIYDVSSTSSVCTRCLSVIVEKKGISSKKLLETHRESCDKKSDADIEQIYNGNYYNNTLIFNKCMVNDSRPTDFEYHGMFFTADFESHLRPNDDCEDDEKSHLHNPMMLCVTMWKGTVASSIPARLKTIGAIDALPADSPISIRYNNEFFVETKTFQNYDCSVMIKSAVDWMQKEANTYIEGEKDDAEAAIASKYGPYYFIHDGKVVNEHGLNVPEDYWIKFPQEFHKAVSDSAKGLRESDLNILKKSNDVSKFNKEVSNLVGKNLHFKDEITKQFMQLPGYDTMNILNKDNKCLNFYASKTVKCLIELNDIKISEGAKTFLNQLYKLLSNPPEYFKCTYCEKTKVRKMNIEHDHKTMLVRGFACDKCNQNLRRPRTFPVYFHNGSGYDFKLLLKTFKAENPNFDSNKVKLTPVSSEKFMNVQLGNLMFYDSLKHLNGSLDSLVKEHKKRLKKEKLEEVFKITFRGITRNYPKLTDKNIFQDSELVDILTSKAAYPYFFNSCEENDKQKEFPPYEEFCKHYKFICNGGLNNEKINKEFCSNPDCSHSRRICSKQKYGKALSLYKKLDFKCFLEYTKFYCQLDTLLLADVMNTYIMNIREIYGVDPCYHSSCAGVAYDALRRTVSKEWADIRKHIKYSESRNNFTYNCDGMTKILEVMNKGRNMITKWRPDYMRLRGRKKGLDYSDFSARATSPIGDFDTLPNNWCPSNFIEEFEAMCQDHVILQFFAGDMYYNYKEITNNMTKICDKYKGPHEVKERLMDILRKNDKDKFFDYYMECVNENSKLWMPKLLTLPGIPNTVELHNMTRAMIRGGYSAPGEKRYSERSKTRKIIFLDATSQYPTAMTKNLPTFVFKEECTVTEDMLMDETYDSFLQHMVEVDLEAPPEIHDNFAGYPPFIDHLTVDPKHSIFNQLNYYYTGVKPPTVNNKLVAHFQPCNMILPGFQVAQMLSLGIKLKKIHRAVCFVCLPYLKNFIDTAYNERAKDKDSPRGNTFKIILNSSYGKFIERIDLRGYTVTVDTEVKRMKYCSKPRFKRVVQVGEDFGFVELHKDKVVIDRSFVVGAWILGIAKHQMYDMLHNVVFKSINLNSELRTRSILGTQASEKEWRRVCLLATDTDSMVLEIDSNKEFDESLWIEKIVENNLHHYLDLSKLKKWAQNVVSFKQKTIEECNKLKEEDYDAYEYYLNQAESVPKDRALLGDELLNKFINLGESYSNITGLGTFGCEVSAPILRFVALSSKVYNLETHESNKMTHKGIQKAAVSHMTFEDYKKQLDYRASITHTQVSNFRSKHLEINTVHTLKTCLPATNDKMETLLGYDGKGIHQVGYGYKGERYRSLLELNKSMSEDKGYMIDGEMFIKFDEKDGVDPLKLEFKMNEALPNVSLESLDCEHASNELECCDEFW